MPAPGQMDTELLPGTSHFKLLQHNARTLPTLVAATSPSTVAAPTAASAVSASAATAPQLFHYDWVIDDFAALRKSHVERHFSPHFTLDGYTWRLLLFPNGNRSIYPPNSLDTAALYVQWVSDRSPPPQNPHRFVLELLPPPPAAGREPVAPWKKESHHVFSHAENDRGFNPFISMKELMAYVHPPSTLHVRVELERLRFAPSSAYNYLDATYDSKAMTGFVGLKNQGATCFPESDARVLTNSGYLFLSEIEARICAGQQVLYACYDTATKGIVYRPGRLVESAAPTHWVDFTHAGTRHHWDDTSDDYGSTVPVGGVWANRLTLRTTPEHDMYVQLCTRDGEDGHESYEPRLAGDAPIAPHKQTARELAPGYQCECDAAGRTCTHGYSHYRMYTGAASGLHTPADVVSLSDRDPHSPVAALGLQSTDELAAFLELFGYWLGNGTMTYHTRADLASKDAVCFEARNNHDCVCLRDLLTRLHLVCGQHFSSCESDLQLEVRITEPRWFRFFDDEFGVAYSNSRHYDRRLAVPKQGMHSRQRRPSTSTASTVSASAAVSSTRARSLSESASVELVADYSGDDDAEDMSPCEADLVEEEDDRAASDKWLPDWVLFRLGAEQLRLVIEGLHRAAGRSAATAARQQSAAVGDKAMQNEQQICTSSVGFRDQLIHACMHAGYSAYFTLNTATGEVCGHNAVPDHDGFCSEEEMEAALQVDSTRQFKSVCGKQDSWWVCYSEVISELLPAQDVRFDGGTCRVRQKKEQRSGQAIQQQQAAVIATQPADLYDQKRDGRVWCVSVEHEDALIFVQRAHRNASGVVTKVGRTMIVGNWSESRTQNYALRITHTLSASRCSLVHPVRHPYVVCCCCLLSFGLWSLSVT